MTTATLQRDRGFARTAADDDAVREPLATCSSRHEIEPEKKLSVFNRDDCFCLNPRLVDTKTGEILLTCRSRACEYCSKTEAIRMAFKVMRAFPSHEFTITCLGADPDEWKENRKKLIRQLRKISPDFEWFLSIEISPVRCLAHAHGYARFSGQLTAAQFQTAAYASGLGRCEFKRVPQQRSRLAMHYSYPTKSLDSPDPVVRSEFYRWNAKGSKIGFWHSSHGFFKFADDDTEETPENDGSNASISTQDGPEHPQPTDTSSSTHDGSQGRTVRQSAGRIRSFFNERCRALKTLVSDGLIARSRGP